MYILADLVFSLEHIQSPPKRGLPCLGGLVVLEHGPRPVGEFDSVGGCCKET